MEKTEFADVTVTTTCSQAGQEWAVSQLSRNPDCRPLGAEPDVGTAESAFLLVRYGGRRGRLAAKLYDVFEEEVSGGSTSPVGQHSDQPSLG